MNSLAIPILHLLIDLFRKRRFIRETVIPLVDGVKDLPDSRTRRELVLAALIAKGLSEPEARLLIEAGLKVWKRLEKKRTKQAAKQARG